MNITGINRRAQVLSVCCCCPQTAVTIAICEKLEAQGWQISSSYCRPHFLDEMAKALEHQIAIKLDTAANCDRIDLETILPRNPLPPAPAAALLQLVGPAMILDTLK